MNEIETLIDLAKSGDLAGVRRLLSAQPELATRRLSSGETPLMAALYRGHHDIVHALLEHGAATDIFTAAATGRGGPLRMGLLDGMDVNGRAHDGWTALHLAAFFGHVDAARILLEAGADIHAISANSLRNTPLHAATAGKHADVALFLLENGADPHAVDAGGYTPLRIAEENQLSEVVAAIHQMGGGAKPPV